jgi:hypothetical protein
MASIRAAISRNCAIISSVRWEGVHTCLSTNVGGPGILLYSERKRTCVSIQLETYLDAHSSAHV